MIEKIFSGTEEKTGYSRFVSMMKVFLPGLAAVLAGLVLVWPQIVEQKDRFHIEITRPKNMQPDSLRMINARYYSTDKHNQPFTLTADTAIETSPGTRIIELDNPKADIMLKEDSWIAATAHTGFYNQKDETLKLSGDVNIFYDKGYSLDTKDVLIDFNGLKATGTEKVQAQGAFGSIESEGINISEKGKRILFTGKSKLILYPDGKEAQIMK